MPETEQQVIDRATEVWRALEKGRQQFIDGRNWFPKPSWKLARGGVLGTAYNTRHPDARTSGEAIIERRLA